MNKEKDELTQAYDRYKVKERHVKFECLRGCDDCKPLCMIVSDCGGSFICAGENTPESRHFPQDIFRHCEHSDNWDTKVQCDPRDLIDTIHVLSGALHVQESRKAAIKGTESRQANVDMRDNLLRKLQARVVELEAIVNGVYDLDLLIPENPDEPAMIRMDDFVALHKAAIKGDS